MAKKIKEEKVEEVKAKVEEEIEIAEGNDGLKVIIHKVDCEVK